MRVTQSYARFPCFTGVPDARFPCFTGVPDARFPCFPCFTGVPDARFPRFPCFTGVPDTRFACFACFAGFCPLSRYGVSMAMEEKIIERRIQLNRGSFILTIPRDIAKRAGIHQGQSVRFRVRDGNIVISPTGVLGDSAPDSAGPDEVERAIAEMMAKDRSERFNARGTSPGRSKLERLRLK